MRVMAVRGLTRRGAGGVVQLGPLQLPCALGRSGRKTGKREGDGATPIGRFRLLAVLYRPDRRRRPRTRLPVRPIRPADGWCDAPTDRNYNRAVRLPYPASAERMWRDDHLYDLVVVLDHNSRPRGRGLGSAIFMHVARPGFGATGLAGTGRKGTGLAPTSLKPTEGCIALDVRHLERLIAGLGLGASVMID